MDPEMPPRVSYEFINSRGEEEIIFECPCCCLPTSTGPASYDICGICGWEDDDCPGFGPNHCSLEEARANFHSHNHMYDVDRPHAIKPGQEERQLLCIAILQDFKQEPDPVKRGILFDAYHKEYVWL